MIYDYFGGKDQLLDAAFGVVVHNTINVAIDANDLPSYAAQYDRYPEIARLAMWDRRERDGQGIRIPNIVAPNTEKAAAVGEAQRAGRISDWLPPGILLELVFTLVQASFNSVEPFATAPEPETQYRGVYDTVARMIRP